jgi:hypothetical protein
MSDNTTRAILDGRFVDTEVQEGKRVYIIDKKQHARTLLHNLILMHDDEEASLTDVIIVSKEKDKFYFHGPILAALSKKLEEYLLIQGLGSSVTSKIVIQEEFSSCAVQCLWDYAYGSVVTINPSIVNEVKELAECYGLDCLMRKITIRLDYENPELELIQDPEVPEIIINGLHDLLENCKLCSTVVMSLNSLTRV